MKKFQPTFSWRVRNLRARASFAFDKLLGYKRLRRKFFETHLYHLDLQNPLTHSEKVQYRKLFDRRAVYPQITDKIEARNYVDSVLGAGAADRLMVPLLAVVDRFEALDPALKQQDIIIKASHGSGWNQIVRAGSKKDWSAANRRSQHWLSRVSLSRKADISAHRSESPLYALHVEMCMAQHLSLSALRVIILTR